MDEWILDGQDEVGRQFDAGNIGKGDVHIRGLTIQIFGRAVVDEGGSPGVPGGRGRVATELQPGLGLGQLNAANLAGEVGGDEVAGVDTGGAKSKFDVVAALGSVHQHNGFAGRQGLERCRTRADLEAGLSVKLAGRFGAGVGSFAPGAGQHQKQRE